jgi:PncC family amidohydrolase
MVPVGVNPIGTGGVPDDPEVRAGGSTNGEGAGRCKALAASVGDALRGRGWSLSLAESCTGGLVMKVLTDIPGSSRYLVGGLVAYADRAKSGVLGVDAGLLARHGAVSGEVAIAMASEVSRLFGTHVGLSITGIAGPEGAVPGKPVGTVWFGLSRPDFQHSERVRFEGDREAVRRQSALHALEMLHSAAAAEVGGRDAEQNP